MSVTLIGGNSATPIDRTGARYRITWRFVGASIIPSASFDAYNIATKLRDALPPNGIFTVSPIAAIPGDQFVQYTCQLLTSFPGFTLADVVKYGNKLPIIPQGITSLQLDLDVSEVEVRSTTLTSLQIQALDQKSRERALAAAKQAEVTTKVGETVKDAAGSAVDWVKELLAGLSGIVKFAIGGVVVVGIAYVIVKNK